MAATCREGHSSRRLYHPSERCYLARGVGGSRCVARVEIANLANEVWHLKFFTQLRVVSNIFKLRSQQRNERPYG